jgi:hypothetical protein
MSKTTNEKPKRKTKTRRCWNWPIDIPLGNSPYFHRTDFHAFIVFLIQEWPISCEECAMMAYIAEKIWREGHCCESVEVMTTEVELASTDIDLHNKLERAIYRAVVKLESRGVIKRVPIGNSYWYAQGNKGRLAKILCRWRQPHRTEILNIPLRNLLTRPSANAPIMKQAELW